MQPASHMSRESAHGQHTHPWADRVGGRVCGGRREVWDITIKGALSDWAPP